MCWETGWSKLWPALGHVAKKQLSWLECRSWLLDQGSFHIRPYKVSRIEDFFKKHMLVYVCVCTHMYTHLCMQVYNFYCTLLYCISDIVFFINWSSVATLHQAGLSAPFFQQLTVFLCHSLVIFAVFQTFSLLYL